MNNQQNTADNDSFFILIFISVVIIALMFFENVFSGISFQFMKVTYLYRKFIPFSDFFVTNDQIETFNILYRDLKYGITSKHSYERIQASLVFFQIYLFISFIILMWKYLYLTKPATITKKIKKVDELVKISKTTSPAVSIGFAFGDSSIKDKEDQMFGTFSQEFGPPRWAIYNKLVSENGSTIAFKGHGDESGCIIVKDEFEHIKRFSGTLDLNIDKTRDVLAKQLGAKFTGLDSLPDYYLAIIHIFLTYADGDKKKSKILESSYSRLVEYKKPNSSKQKISIKIQRKKVISLITGQLKKHNSFLISESKYNKTFVLSCYAYAKSLNQDVTMPYLLWLKAFDRELYQLLHCYCGDPNKINTSPFIEVIAPMTAFMIQHTATEVKNKLGFNDFTGIYEPTTNAQNILHFVIYKIISTNRKVLPTNFGRKYKKIIFKFNKSEAKRSGFDFLKVKPLSLTNKQKSLISIKISDMKANNYFEQTISAFCYIFDESQHKDISNKKLLTDIAWLKHVEPRIYYSLVFLLDFQSKKNISFKDIYKNFKNYNKSSELINNEDYKRYTDSSGIEGIKYGWDSMMEINNVNNELDITLNALKRNIENESFIIDKSLTSLIYFMTYVESWLTPKYELRDGGLFDYWASNSRFK